MTENVPRVSVSALVREVEQYLLEHAKQLDTIDYLYALDEREVLVGVLSIKDLFSAERNAPVAEVLSRTLVTVRAHTDQERIALLALKHNIKAIPVIDASRHLLGVVAADDILRILDHEATENLAKLGGVDRAAGYETILAIPITRAFRHRIPWLVIGLFGGIATAGIISGFEEILSEYLILAAFIPLIVYLADAIGTQIATFIIRDLALTPTLSFAPYALRHAVVVGLLGGVLSALLFVASLVLYGELMVSVVLALALMGASISALFSGLLVPYLFAKLSFDPANASGPIATITQDILSVVIYLSVALMLLG